jgi:HD-GYP domain-containing protein (c-di-GMP phosphodiesterase class II)
MTTDRVYRTAMSRSAAIEEIRRNAGIQFDPMVVNAFLRAMDAEPGTQSGTISPQAAHR